MCGLALLFYILKIITMLFALAGIVLSVLAMTLKKCRHRDRHMYFGMRLLVGSIIVLAITLALSYGLKH